MAKYDHGGGCACGLSRFCDCSNATEQDRKDREAYDRQFGKKGKNVSNDQREDLYRETNFAGDARAAMNRDKGLNLAHPSPMLDVVDNGSLRVSMTVHGIHLVQHVPMPAEVRKALENVQRAAQAIRTNAS